ncbi:hypothetical protein BV898_12580 [Hypsibius exemplaris]|uniref:Uncharacterized protein n=1 Tax=Hypsibius exemplaris TaxID=2072580 RepID=A0A1W0WD72_HYPEX|nr:hypothetical protein BV898_12580 [Hypsibius exemplaris]
MGQAILGLLCGIVVVVTIAWVDAGIVARSKRQEWCDPEIRYGSLDSSGTNHSVIANCRYYGDRFYECTAWNRLLARNHWILSDGIIPAEMWTNKDERVRIAECKFFQQPRQFRCRQACVAGTCGKKCPWGGYYEGTPTAGFKQTGGVYDHPEPQTVAPYNADPNVVYIRRVDN